MRCRWGLIGLLAIPALGIAVPLPRFTQPNAIWNVDVSHAQLRTNSAAMMTHLAGFSSLGWGDDRNFDFQIDFGMETSTVSTPGRSPTNSSICSLTCGPIGQPGEVRLNVTCTSAPESSIP